MIELIITISILSFGIIMVYNAFTALVMITNSSSSKMTAAYLAKEGMEIVKNIRDNNLVNGLDWDDGLTSCASGCQADYKAGTAQQSSANELQPYNANTFLKLTGDGLYGYDTGSTTVFLRKITMEAESADVMLVTVDVYWSYNSKSYTFSTEGYLYNWYD